MSLHPSELAILEREIHYDWIRSLPTVPPGTTAEWDAVERIDGERRADLHELRRPSRLTMRLDR